MKKIITWLLAAALLAGLCAAMTLTASAEEALEFVDPVYTFDVTVSADYWGNGNNITPDGRWAFEYYDRTGQQKEGWYMMEGWDANAQHLEPYSGLTASGEENGYTYCRHRYAGKSLHPGNLCDCVRAFIVPADGTVAYDVVMSADHAKNLRSEGNDGLGTDVSVWLNDTCVWPTKDNVDGAIITDASVEAHCATIFNDDGKINISIENLTVKAGDRIRLRVGAHGDYRGMKSTAVDSCSVTYLTSTLPIGNPKGLPVEDLAYDAASLTPHSVTITWSNQKNAVGYNVFLNDQKVTETPVPAAEGTLSYELTGLEAGKVANVRVTTLTSVGESEEGSSLSIRTPKEEASSDASSASEESDVPDTTDTSSAPVSDTGTASSPAASDTGTASAAQGGSNAGTVVAIVVIAVVVVAAAVAVFFVLKKKKGQK